MQRRGVLLLLLLLALSTLSWSATLPLLVTEYHSEAIVGWLRTLGSSLPDGEMATIVHWDSHADMDMPRGTVDIEALKQSPFDVLDVVEIQTSMPSIECTVLRRLRNAFAPRTLDAIYLHAEDEHRVVCATDAGGEHRAAHEPRLEGKPANTTEVLVEQSKIVAIGIALITCIGAAALWLNKSPGKRSSTTSKRKPRKLGKR